MICLNKSETNIVILELLYKATLQSPIYLFEFNKKDSDFTKSFISTDISNAACKYQRFDIEETVSEDLLNGKVSLLVGEYDYSIYEIETLDLNATKISTIQQGITIVSGQADSIYS